MKTYQIVDIYIILLHNQACEHLYERAERVLLLTKLSKKNKTEADD